MGGRRLNAIHGTCLDVAGTDTLVVIGLLAIPVGRAG